MTPGSALRSRMTARPDTGYTGIPSWIYAIAAAGAFFVLLPLAAMMAKVNWAQFIPLITSESSLTALGLSLRTSAASTALCIVIGVPLALVLARASFPGQRLLLGGLGPEQEREMPAIGRRITVQQQVRDERPLSLAGKGQHPARVGGDRESAEQPDAEPTLHHPTASPSFLGSDPAA